MDIPQLVKILRPHALFENLKDEDWPGLLEGHRFRNLAHHATLYSAGEPAERFAIVLTGAFKLVRSTPRGEDSIMYFATPGDVIGGLIMLKAHSAFPISAVSLGASTVLELPRATFARSWANNSSVQLKMNATLYSRMSALQEDKANSKLTLNQRIAALLLGLLDRNNAADDKQVPIPLTRREIAEAVGSTVESVIRCLSEMSQQGFLITEDRKIEVLRVDKLAEMLKNP